MKILMAFFARSFKKTEMIHRDGGRSFALSLALVLGLFSLEAKALDTERAQELMGICATCHGEFGQGGSRGEYPRLAGQSDCP